MCNYFLTLVLNNLSVKIYSRIIFVEWCHYKIFHDLYNYTYNSDSAIGEATPIELKDQSYYTETLKSLFFSGDGFVIINGDEENRAFYNYEGTGSEKKVIIYSREKIDDKDTKVENYDFWCHDFGTLSDSKEFNYGVNMVLITH